MRRLSLLLSTRQQRPNDIASPSPSASRRKSRRWERGGEGRESRGLSTTEGRSVVRRTRERRHLASSFLLMLLCATTTIQNVGGFKLRGSDAASPSSSSSLEEPSSQSLLLPNMTRNQPAEPAGLAKTTYNHTQQFNSSVTSTKFPSTSSSSSSSSSSPWSFLDSISKKTAAVLTIMLFGLVVGLVINFANLHNDFEDLRDFHRGYLGRRMLIAEGKLTSREYLDAIKKVQDIRENGPGVCNLSALAAASNQVAMMGNGHVSQIYGQIEFFNMLSNLNKERRRAEPHNHSNFIAYTAIRPFAGVEPVGQPNHLEWLQQHLPLYASHFIEDHDPEWRDLDYSIEIGEPPVELSEFILQYDFKVFNSITDEFELSRRQNLLYQFRKWKKRRRKLWRIVVTERAKKEMANKDHSIGGGGRR